MKKFLVETHSHTSEVSPCATCTAAQYAELFVQHGYSTAILTNHLSRGVYNHKNLSSWDEYIDLFMHGFELTKNAVNGRFNLIMGVEINFTGESNDYLAYGVTEEFLRKNRDLTELSPKEFYPIAKENGVLLMQAHPFRFGTKIIKPDYLDGYEIYNGNPRHNSNNDIAAAWAKKYDKLVSYGTDFHEPGDIALSGMLFDAPINTSEDYINALKEKSGTGYQPK